MDTSDEFGFFREWMAREPMEWAVRKDADLSVPTDLKAVFGREIIPVYARFLNEFGALWLIKLWSDIDAGSDMYDYMLLALNEMIQVYLDCIVLFNFPEENVDFSHFMPFCQLSSTGIYYCFDTRYYGTDDLPVIEFDIETAIPDHELKTAVSFRYWLKKIVKFGSPNIDYMPEFPSEPMNLLRAVYEGKLRATDGDNLYHEGQARRFKGRLPCHENEYFHLDKREVHANSFATDLAAIAKWRYEGWPTTCFKCGKPLDLDSLTWEVTQKFDEHSQSIYYLIHEDCADRYDDAEEEDDPDSDLDIEIE